MKVQKLGLRTTVDENWERSLFEVRNECFAFCGAGLGVNISCIDTKSPESSRQSANMINVDAKDESGCTIR